MESVRIHAMRSSKWVKFEKKIIECRGALAPLNFSDLPLGTIIQIFGCSKPEARCQHLFLFIFSSVSRCEQRTYVRFTAVLPCQAYSVRL